MARRKRGDGSAHGTTPLLHQQAASRLGVRTLAGDRVYHGHMFLRGVEARIKRADRGRMDVRADLLDMEQGDAQQLAQLTVGRGCAVSTPKLVLRLLQLPS